MFKTLKQSRAAISMLSPERIRSLAGRPVTIGLVAATDAGYADMEEFLLPPGMPSEERSEAIERLHRAGEPNAPERVDLVLYELGIPRGKGVFGYYPQDPDRTVTEILEGNEDLAIPLARQFPVFRKSVVEDVIQSVSRENTLFAIATALPNVVPNFMELPWALGEFASDTFFITANQIRMAFAIAAACGKEVGFKRQKAEILTLAAGAFGWRALARELVGFIPLGQGLIPKGAIAYAGTFAVGKGLQHLYHANVPYTREERVSVYRQALERGREVATSLKLHGGRVRARLSRADRRRLESAALPVSDNRGTPDGCER